MKVKIATLGCRNNQYESAEIRACFEKEGFQPVPFDNEADICVINTCSVTEKSNYRCRQLIRKTVNSNPESFIVVVGCYPQLDSESVEAINGIDLILGNEEKLDIPGLLKNLNSDKHKNIFSDSISHRPYPQKRLPLKSQNKKPVVFVNGIDKKPVFRYEDVNHFSGKTKAFLKIQTGCNFNCSFCVITVARGVSRSAEPTNVARQFEKLLNNGFREISLTGIHLGSYGKDLSPATNLSELLQLLMKIEGNFRIRLSSLGPKDITDDLIDLIAGSPKICNHLHISLQSGTDKILRLMKRNYRMNYFSKLIDKIRNRIPYIGLGADMIAGFPGETDKDFKDTLRVINDIPFSYLHVFNFSRRENTVASNLPDQAPHKIRKKRVLILKELAKKKSSLFKEKFLGKNLDLLVEHNRDSRTGMLKGYTDNYLPVQLEGSDDLMNRIISVRLTRIGNDILYGSL